MIRTAITVAAAGIATSASLVTISYFAHARDQRQEDINVAVCTAVTRLDGAITDTLERSLVNLPKLAYYRDHPDELARQQRDTKSTLKQFRPPPECGKKGAMK